MSEAGVPEAAEKAMKNRFERVEKEARGKLWLTERDELLLTELFLHQAMSRGQIQALHFGSTPRCNARLRMLFDHGYVARDFHPMAPYGTQGIYRIGPKAASVVARRLDADASYVRQLCRGGRRPEFIEHTLEIVDFYLAVRAATEREPTCTIESWMPEMQVRHEYEVEASGGASRKQVFKPDAFLRLSAGGGLHAFFIEIDRGNASASVFEQKVPHYRQYRGSGLFEEMYGKGEFRVLVVTTGEKRQAHLCEQAGRQGGDFFWFTSQKELQSQGPLASIWTSPERDALSLVGLATGTD